MKRYNVLFFWAFLLQSTCMACMGFFAVHSLYTLKIVLYEDLFRNMTYLTAILSFVVTPIELLLLFICRKRDNSSSSDVTTSKYTYTLILIILGIFYVYFHAQWFIRGYVLDIVAERLGVLNNSEICLALNGPVTKIIFPSAVANIWGSLFYLVKLEKHNIL